MRFFVGLHQPSDAAKVTYPAFISVNRIRNRKSLFSVCDWIMDSGAFSTIKMHGGYPHGVGEYAAQIKRWSDNGNLLAAVAQDFMCEPVMLTRTGLTIADHQRLTIERYEDLLREDCGGVYIMPVLQGYSPDEYSSHVRQYRDLLTPGAWVGVGSVCKRNADPRSIRALLDAITSERPDLRLHGFGLKITALSDGYIRERFATSDSMAWSFAARIQGRNGNSWKEAQLFAEKIQCMPYQKEMF